MPRRSLNRGSLKMARLVKFIGDRDEWTCWICGEIVMKERIENHPLAPSLDHIIPRSKGGSNKRDNLRITHRDCNSRRKNDDA